MIDWVSKAIMGLLLSALIALGGYSFHMRSENSDLKKEVSDLNITLDNKNLIIDRYVSNAKDTAAIIDQFKESLRKVKELSDLKAEEVRKALAQVEILAEQHETYSASLLATIPKSSNMCKEAEDMINSYLAKERSE